MTTVFTKTIVVVGGAGICSNNINNNGGAGFVMAFLLN